jgi:hypothetical protein
VLGDLEMKKADIVKALESIDDDVEVVVGDSDFGRFFEPNFEAKIQKLFFMETYNPLNGRRYRDYLDKEKYALREREDHLRSGWEPGPIQIVRCLKI